MLKVGLIAQGSITSAHYPAYIEMEEKGIAIVEAVADIRPEMFDKHKRLKNTANIKEYSDYNELIEAEAGKLDFVDICLPTFLHCDAACKAMEAGINVIVEKPMALSYEQCVKMCETAKKTGKKLMVAQCCRFEPFADAVRDYMKSGELGALKTATFKRDGGTPTWGWENWFLKEELSGGALLDLHVHDVDLMQDLFGIPECLSSGGTRVIPGDGIDILSTNYYYKNGFFAHTTGDWTTANNQCYGRVYRVDFEKGFLIKANMKKNTVFSLFKADGTEVDLSEKYPAKNMYTAEIMYFADCVANDKPVEKCLPETTADSIRIALAEKASCENKGERIYL